jgi:hypothetical protein
MDPADEAELFGKSIAAKLRTFNRYNFALARRNIENALFDIEFGQEERRTNYDQENYFQSL